MMKMKGRMLYLCTFVLSVFAFACNNNQEELGSIVSSGMGGDVIVEAVLLDGTESRVSLMPGENEDGNPVVNITWDKEDAFWVLQCVVEGQLFSKTEEGNLFTGTLPVGGQDDFVAFYPPVVQENGYGWRLDEAVPVELDKQTGSLDKNKTYMTAKSADGKSFVFRHLTALLKPSFSGLPSDVSINRIVVGVSGKCVNGILYKEDYPMWDRGGNEITIDYDTPVGQDTDFYIYLPPIEQDKRLTFAVTTTDGKIYQGELNLSKKVEEGKLYTADVTLAEEEIPYLTFSAETEQTLCMSISVGYLEYSVNGDEWKELSTWHVKFGGEHGDLRLRGKDYSGTVIPGNNYEDAQITFKNSDVYVSCSGDIRTLAGYESYKTDKPFASFSGLFKDCTVLKTAPNLPSMSLQSCCYENMFSGCTSLETAPELPATNLAYGCYENMFYGCTSLAEAPKLPAINLASLCYQKMFYGCTSLKTAPALHATNLEYGCYASMFSGCTSLETAPELPATDLEVYCYFNMFWNCTSLSEAPKLPAVNLKSSCYESMFWGCKKLEKAPTLNAQVLAPECYSYMFSFCSNLKEVTMLATDITAKDCLNNWLIYTAAIGTFYKNASVEDVSTYQIPAGWDVKEYE